MNRKCQEEHVDECSIHLSKFLGHPNRHRHADRWSPSVAAFLKEESRLNVSNRNDVCV